MAIPFHPLSLADGPLIQEKVRPTESRNCDLNFMNLFSWRFLYETEVAFYKNWLLFRFKANGHRAYMAPVGGGNWQGILAELLDDAEAGGHPFLMLGVCENTLTLLEQAMPDYFYATADRNFTDYLYQRDALATFAGKKLQSKRNFANRFARLYPDFTYSALTPADFDECLELDTLWEKQKAEAAETGLYTYRAEQRSLQHVFAHWQALGGQGGVLRVEGRIVAFTYGGSVNYDTFDVCAEKADTHFEGAYPAICREFVRRLPPQFTLINREEDLGIEGLRKAKLSYNPHILLHKFTVMTRHPMQRA